MPATDAVFVLLAAAAASAASDACPTGHPHVLIQSSPQSPSVSICACAKCSSTTLLLSVYKSLSGHPVPAALSKRIHSIDEWGLANVTRSCTAGSVHFIAQRDPVTSAPSAPSSCAARA